MCKYIYKRNVKRARRRSKDETYRIGRMKCGCSDMLKVLVVVVLRKMLAKKKYGKFNLTDEIQVYLVVFVAMYATSVLRFCPQIHRLLSPYLLSYFIFGVFGFFCCCCKNGVSFWTCYWNTCTFFICYCYYNFLCVRCLAFYFADVLAHHHSPFETIKPWTMCWFNCYVVFDSCTVDVRINENALIICAIMITAQAHDLIDKNISSREREIEIENSIDSSPQLCTCIHFGIGSEYCSCVNTWNNSLYCYGWYDFILFGVNRVYPVIHTAALTCFCSLIVLCSNVTAAQNWKSCANLPMLECLTLDKIDFCCRPTHPIDYLPIKFPQICTNFV